MKTGNPSTSAADLRPIAVCLLALGLNGWAAPTITTQPKDASVSL